MFRCLKFNSLSSLKLFDMPITTIRLTVVVKKSTEFYNTNLRLKFRPLSQEKPLSLIICLKFNCSILKWVNESVTTDSNSHLISGDYYATEFTK